MVSMAAEQSINPPSWPWLFVLNLHPCHVRTTATRFDCDRSRRSKEGRRGRFLEGKQIIREAA
jgi:hypothetical protein